MTSLYFLTIFSLITLLICKDAYFLPLDINNKLRRNFEKKDSISSIEKYFYPNIGNDMYQVDDNIFKRHDPKELYPITIKRFFAYNNNFEKRKIEDENYDFVPIAKPSWAGLGGVWGKRSYN
uniref:Uncharacterized protein n=1 Tax=Strongyloides venezuelensis TaxID=75913 RepID=A0A0K0FML2_STRVS